MAETLTEMVANYKRDFSLMSSKEKAVWERRIYDAAPYEQKGPGAERERFLAELFGQGAPTDYRLRFELLNAHDWATPLWERIDKESMPLHTAIRLLRAAKKRSNTESLPVAEAMDKLLAEYGELAQSRLPSGKVVRKRTPTKLGGLDDVARGKQRKRVEKAKLADPRVFWPHLRSMVAQHVALRLVDADPIVAEQLWREFERDLKVLVDEMAHKLYRVTQTQKKDNEAKLLIKAHKMREACALLAIDPPRRGKAVDLKLANKHKRKLLALYHPDSHGGNDHMRSQFEAVSKAYQILEQYNEQIAQTATDDEPTETEGESDHGHANGDANGN